MTFLHISYRRETMVNNKLVYFPDNQFAGNDTFIYSAKDGGQTANASVTIKVNYPESYNSTMDIFFTPNKDAEGLDSYRFSMDGNKNFFGTIGMNNLLE